MNESLASMIDFGTRIEKDGRGVPVRLSREDFGKGHMHIRGRTRSGKTSMAMIPLAKQLMAPYPDPTDQSEQPRLLQDPVFIFDLGGDQALFWSMLHTAEVNGRRESFKFLSLARDEQWQYFDPFQAVDPSGRGRRNIIRLANLFIEAFNLDNGLIYGGQYFTQQNLAALLDVVRALYREKGSIQPTLQEVSDYLDLMRRVRRNQFRDADQIRMTFNFLLEYPQLQPTVDDKRAGNVIDMMKALENPAGEVVYFFMPTLNESTTARQIAGLGLYSVINAAIEKRKRDSGGVPPSQHIWVFIDEFQELAGRSFASLLAQAGKFGITFILANQTTEQLENRDTSLAQIVYDNCHVKQYFTVTSNRDIEDLQALSKETKIWLGTETPRGPDTTLAMREVVMPRLRKNRILDVSATKGHTFLIMDDGKGHREPQRVVVAYSTDEKKYLADTHRRLPLHPLRDTKETDGQAVAKPKSRPPARSQMPRLTPPARREQLEQLLRQKQEAEGFH